MIARHPDRDRSITSPLRGRGNLSERVESGDSTRSLEDEAGRVGLDDHKVAQTPSTANNKFTGDCTVPRSSSGYYQCVGTAR